MTEQNPQQDHGRLIVQGADRPGIVSSVSRVLTEHGANIVALDQSSSDPEGGRFFQRTVFHLPKLSMRFDELNEALRTKLGDELGLDFHLVEAKRRKRVAIFVSKADHCLLDLLWRQRRGELSMTVPMVVSNHPDLGEEVRRFEIPFFHVPVEKDSKPAAEKEQLNLLNGNVDLLVLARYMQILSGDFLEELGVPVINIHHSFLPAFMGAGPYLRAKERGVKLIGATAHYVTEDLDEGPIIEQDVIRVSHRESARDLQRKGADVERSVLARAVAWHCEDRIIRDGNTSVVF
ncbi:formyltetrahydrofolate deformylase [Phytoactinopolyspora mesophila]|uniref:Formyltetrahydrofolate deformylase n=1 Tax=Phytoactinopolyspora mesophila TaxID=2650750 RepID=A0A7K3LZJ7_9ACTN|nr:formyltetrahydrofolate deformylase [Phytoactinopolyspora mesophila]NDL56445.1 formyltetrahydrofolate deformylase [Phytoactinopolyspora mesophila]